MDATRENISYLLEYVDYRSLTHRQIREFVAIYQEGESIGDTLERSSLDKAIVPSNLGDLNPRDALNLYQYMSYRTFLEKTVYLDLTLLRSITIGEESIQLINQMLEYLCSGGNVEELKIAEERHT